MSVAKIVELTADSPKNFEDAMRIGMERARQTLDGVKGAWIKDQEVRLADDGTMTYRVHMKVTFVMNR